MHVSYIKLKNVYGTSSLTVIFTVYMGFLQRIHRPLHLKNNIFFIKTMYLLMHSVFKELILTMLGKLSVIHVHLDYNYHKKTTQCICNGLRQYDNSQSQTVSQTKTRHPNQIEKNVISQSFLCTQELLLLIQQQCKQPAPSQQTYKQSLDDILQVIVQYKKLHNQKRQTLKFAGINTI